MSASSYSFRVQLTDPDPCAPAAYHHRTSQSHLPHLLPSGEPILAFSPTSAHCTGPEEVVNTAPPSYVTGSLRRREFDVLKSLNAAHPASGEHTHTQVAPPSYVTGSYRRRRLCIYTIISLQLTESFRQRAYKRFFHHMLLSYLRISVRLNSRGRYEKSKIGLTRFNRADWMGYRKMGPGVSVGSGDVRRARSRKHEPRICFHSTRSSYLEL